MKILILSAGFGVRLRPLTLFTNKALLWVKGKKVIDHLLDNFSKTGNHEYYITVTHVHCKKFEKWALKRKEPITLLCNGVTKEKDKKGAIKDFVWSLQFLNFNQPLLVIGGDNLFDFNLQSFVDFCLKENKSVIALYELENINLAKLYGTVELENDYVKSLVEKPREPKSRLVAMCLYYLRPEELFNSIEFAIEYGKLDAIGYLIKYLIEKNKIKAYNFGSNIKWVDIGNFKQYLKAQFV